MHREDGYVPTITYNKYYGLPSDVEDYEDVDSEQTCQDESGVDDEESGYASHHDFAGYELSDDPPLFPLAPIRQPAQAQVQATAAPLARDIAMPPWLAPSQSSQTQSRNVQAAATASIIPSAILAIPARPPSQMQLVPPAWNIPLPQHLVRAESSQGQRLSIQGPSQLPSMTTQLPVNQSARAPAAPAPAHASVEVSQFRSIQPSQNESHGAQNPSTPSVMPPVPVAMRQPGQAQAAPPSTRDSPFPLQLSSTQSSHNRSQGAQAALASPIIPSPALRQPAESQSAQQPREHEMASNSAHMQSFQNERQSPKGVADASALTLVSAGRSDQNQATPLIPESRMQPHLAHMQQMHNNTMRILQENKERVERHLNNRINHLDTENRRLVLLGQQQYDENCRRALLVQQQHDNALRALQQEKGHMQFRLNGEIEKLQLMVSRLQAENTALRQTCNNFAQEVEKREREESQRKTREEEEARREAYRRETQEMLGQNRVM